MHAETHTIDNGIFLLDIGNTNMKWAVLRDGHPGKITSILHRGEDIRELADREWSSVAVPNQVYISSVVGKELEDCLSAWIRQHWGLEPRFIQSTIEACGVVNSYREPERLGVDRWLSMIAVYSMSPGAVCVVDCGTAVTIDLIGSDGQHLGGLILPGFELMRQALAEKTSIPFEGGVKHDGLLATDTESAIAAGGVNAVAALVEKIVQDVATHHNATPELVLTGGDAAVLQGAVEIPSRIEVDLVLQGLIVIIKNETD